MNFSQRTIQILKNFSIINPSVQFTSSNVLRTISPNKTILAKATLADQIDSTFAIYDLSRFLGVVSMFSNPDLVANDKQMTIKENGRRVKYTFADPSNLILPPNKDIQFGDADVSFDLESAKYIEITKAISVMGFPELVVVGESGKILLRATDTKNTSADHYDIEVGETDLEFTAVFKTDNLKIMNQIDYQVNISKKGISHFVGDDIEYWISLENTSRFV